MPFEQIKEKLVSLYIFVHSKVIWIVEFFRRTPVARSFVPGAIILLIGVIGLVYMSTRPSPDADILIADKKKPHVGVTHRILHIKDRIQDLYKTPHKTDVKSKELDIHKPSSSDISSVLIYQKILPQPLSPVSMQRYQEVFQNLRDKNISEALNQMQMIQDQLLHPDVEIEMKQLSIAKTLKQRVQKTSSVTDRINEAFGTHLKHYTEVHAVEKQLLYSPIALQQSGVVRAVNVIKQTPNLTPDERAYLFAQLALHALQFGTYDVADAYLHASNNATQSRWGYPIFLQGLLAWRESDLKKAQSFFTVAANAPLASNSIRVAAAFWAARSSVTDRFAYDGWLKRAAKYSDDFYGIVAQAVLDNLYGKNSEHGNEVLDMASLKMDIELVRHLPKGERLFGLLQIRELDAAQLLLNSMVEDERRNKLAASALREVGGFVGLKVSGSESDTTVPLATSKSFFKMFVPQGGFKLNPALIYGVVHVESRFNNQVVSSAGAVGLMQIQPQTARFVMKPEPVSIERLYQPSYNLYVGQRYLQQLPDLVDSKDLFHVLAAYNAGPAAVMAWEKKAAAISEQVKKDPFYFLETLPNVETRSYVRHVIAQSWLYAGALHLPMLSKKALARGEWPLMKNERTVFAH